MRVATMTSPHHIEISEAETPICKANEVRLHIKQIGICGSDIHVWHGQHPFTDYPIIQGHEFIGIIDAIGDNVHGEEFPMGRLATALPQMICGNCNPCQQGKYHICENLKVRGFQAHGCGQDYFVTDAKRIILLPKDFNLDQGAFVEPTAVAVHAIQRLDDIEGQNIIITGAGTIGNLIAQIAQLKGANVLLLDIEDNRLKIAQHCGITHVANNRDAELKELSQKYFGDEGFSIAIEASGAEPALQPIIPIIQKGGTILLVGVYPHWVSLDMARASEHELTLKGSMMYWTQDWEQAAKYLHKDICIEPLITHRFAFEEWQKAYEYIDDNPQNALKVMIEVNEL
ncbi:MAG: zinc-binding dehydrogenase [Alphaproteobacteria bacterium]